ncbi:MAG: GIY-YIG nuclease family protein [Crocinitomicaceae bacterium]
MYYTYVLYSPSLNTFYKGSTNDLESRLYRHNHGYEKFTKKGVPWELIWFTQKPTKSDAIKLEFKLKNLSHDRLKAFIIKFNSDINPNVNSTIFFMAVGSNLDEII